MRRLLTTLMILLVVVVAGFSALVLLVNPNDFRSYLVRQVEARSGYQLNLEGPLRWHVWPQLSILSGRMSLRAPGASQPLVSADNMRLDVALIPLLSHQLQVNQVMLKGAVIQLTPQTEARRPLGAPVGPADSIDEPLAERGWSFDVAKLQIADSLLVFQHAGDEQMTVRNINLQMEQDENRKARLEFSSRINRDQRDLSLSLAADLDVSDFPHQLTAKVSQINYALQGAGLPESGISGSGSLLLGWRESQQQLALKEINLTANDSDLQGEIAVSLRGKPEWLVKLHSTNLNFDNLALPERPADSGGERLTQKKVGTLPRPVIADGLQERDYRSLTAFMAKVNLTANAVRWRGLTFTEVQAALNNQYGLLNIETLAGKLGKGSLSLPGELDARGDEPALAFQPDIHNIEIAQILKAFNYPIALSGLISLRGEFSGDRLNAEAFRRSWKGNAQLTMTHSRMQGMNFQQLIQQAVSRSNSSIEALQNYDNATELREFSTVASLNNGVLALNEMKGESNILLLTGNGTLDLVKQFCDTAFNVRVIDGWKGSNSKLIAMLKNTAIPLRVYGPWQQLNYSLQVDQALRKQLQDEAKRRLSDWVDKHQQNDKAKDLKQLLDKL